jgi:aspartyl-tRNA(Asn)/glutamyl-tRNA(Gln) amidotransferase subunit A
MVDAELSFQSIRELGPRLASGEVSPVEVLDGLLARIEQYNGTLNAYLHVDADSARAEARAAEKAIASGDYIGPLHGIPIAHKDIFHVRGMPTTGGSRLMAGFVADADCTVAQRLRSAGTVCVGKLNTLEFASGSMEVYGTARNPWHTDRHPSGSSSGSGVALAARLIHGASGSDTGGSIRLPAAACGVVGLKPTYGRVSRTGILPLSWSLDHPGPMARTVADAALLFQPMAGADAADPSSSAQPVPDYASALSSDIRGLRVGVPREYFFDGADPSVISAVRDAVAVMEQLGAEIHEVELPWSAFSSSASWAIAYIESFAIHRARFFARARDYTPAFLHKVAGAACLSAEEHLTAERVRERVSAEFNQALQVADVLVMPTTAYTAHPVTGPNPQPETHSLTRAASLTGLPTLAMPCGFVEGLPVSMQLTGRAWDEGTVLRLGHAYEQAVPWSQQRAPIDAHGNPRIHPAQCGLECAVDATWVLDHARLNGLSFVTPENAEPIAASIGPQKTQLAASSRLLED